MNIALLASEISVVVLALFLLVFDLLLPKQETRRSLGYLAVCGVTAILVYTATRYGDAASVYHGFFVVDNFALFFKQLFLAVTLLTILFSFDYVEKMTRSGGEFYALLLFALLGMMVMASASDFSKSGSWSLYSFSLRWRSSASWGRGSFRSLAAICGQSAL